MTPSPSFSAGPRTPPHDAARRTLSPAERLRSLEERKRTLHQEYAKLDHALAEGRISAEEYRYYLAKAFGGKLEHELLRDLEAEERSVRERIEATRSAAQSRVPALTAAFAILLLVGLGSAFLLSHAGLTPTAYVTYSTVDVTAPVSFLFTASGTEELGALNTSGLKASGLLTNGSASLYLLSGEERLLVWQGTASLPPVSVSTERASYALNESVNVAVTPASAAYTLWVTDESGAKALLGDGYVTAAPGSYVLDALINDSGNITKASTTFLVRNDTNTSNDLPREPLVASLAFADACEESCAILPSGNRTLALEAVLSDGASLAITAVTTTEERENTAPVLTAPVPDLTVAAGETATMDLSQHFSDPDGDAITYDYMNVPGVAMSVDDNLLTVTGIAAGEGQSVIYASDLTELVQSNLFTVTVLPGEAPSEENGTTPTENANNGANTTSPGNGTTNITTNVTLPESTANATGGENASGADVTTDCSSADPNALSLECLYADAPEYFPDQEILVQDLDRKPVARFTPIGNLLLTGRAISHSGASPGARDFKIGYVDRDGKSVATIWIDSETGDLHLRGSLHEENANLAPFPGSYSLVNKRSIFLAYADQYNGELYIRGNVIPYRESIMR